MLERAESTEVNAVERMWIKIAVWLDPKSVLALGSTCKRMLCLVSVHEVWGGRPLDLFSVGTNKCNAGIRVVVRDEYPLFIQYVLP